MSNKGEQGQLKITGQAFDSTSNSAAPRYNLSAVHSRPLITGITVKSDPGLAVSGNNPATPTREVPPAPEEPPRPWDFLKRISRTGHSGWLVTTLIFILIVAMSLSFAFVKGWLDPKSTLIVSIIFLVLLFAAMLIAHWPSRNAP
jgi:hypothetical protein